MGTFQNSKESPEDWRNRRGKSWFRVSLTCIEFVKLDFYKSREKLHVQAYVHFHNNQNMLSKIIYMLNLAWYVLATFE